MDMKMSLFKLLLILGIIKLREVEMSFTTDKIHALPILSRKI